MLLKNLATEHSNTRYTRKKETSNMNALLVLFAIVMVIAMIVFGPLITIWALDTLFPVLHIPYSFDTWLSVIVLGGLFKSNVNVNKD